MVTLVADKVQRQLLRKVALILKTNCIRLPRGQLPSSSYNHQYPENPHMVTLGTGKFATEVCNFQVHL